MTNRDLIIRLSLVACLLFTSTAAICNKKQTLTTASEAIKDINGDTLSAVRAVDKAYTEGLITLAKKDALADLLIKLADGGLKATTLLRKLKADFPDGDIPIGQWATLNAFLDDKLVSVFLDVLKELGALSPANSDAIRLAIVGIRSAILVLAGVFGRRASVEKTINESTEATWRTKILAAISPDGWKFSLYSAQMS